MAKFTLTTPDGTKFQLNDNDEIHRGGEGRILAIASDATLVAKIYHDGISPISQEQYNFLSQLDRQWFVVPVDLLLEKTGNIAGFTMEYIGKEFFPLSSIFTKSFCFQNAITDDVKQKIAANLIQALEIAHKSKLVVGDLNQYNILINSVGDIKLIDVDSYQTPNHIHSGMLLEDIRDYFHGGFVSANSDFFALSVLVFNSFTYAHPFKGIHKKYRTLSERMRFKLPIFITDPDLIPPKCYEPIVDDGLQNQFSRLYLNGERFLLNLASGMVAVSKKPKPQMIDKIIEQDLIISPILQNINIINTWFNTEYGIVETDDLFIGYNAKNKGYLNERFRISKAEYSAMYLGSENILVRKGQQLFHYKSPTEIIELTNYAFPKESVISQYNDMLVVVDNEIMTWVYLNEIMNHSIQNKRIDVFGKGFKKYSSFIQNAGGILRIFYQAGKDIATVKLSVLSAKDIFQQANVGIIQWVENNRVINKYFKINGLNIEIATNEVEMVFNFAFMPTQGTEGFIFEPSDNKINIIRTSDFQKTSEMLCSFVSEQSRLHYTKAGILAWEGKSVYLLNKK